MTCLIPTVAVGYRDDLHVNVLQLINESKWEALEQMGRMKLQHGGDSEAGGPDGEHNSFNPLLAVAPESV